MIRAIALTLILVATAAAQSININFYNSDGGNQNPESPAVLEGPAGGLGETWNQFNTTRGTGLLDTSGQPTGVGFSNNVTSGWRWGNPAIAALKAGRAHFGKGVDTTLTLTGLEAGALYDVWIACAAVNTTPPEQSAGAWSTTNPTTTPGPQAISNVGDPVGDEWIQGNNFVRIDNVQADSSGRIALTGDAAEGHRLPLSALQLTPGGIRVPLEVTGVEHDQGRDEFTITWRSNPGEFYGIYASDDLGTFSPGVAAAVPAAGTGNLTSFGPFPNPEPGNPHLFFRVGPPDLEDPELRRVWGNGTTVSLTFSEPLNPDTATEPFNYTVAQFDALWPITAAVLSADGATVTLTTGSPLPQASTFDVSVHNITDRAGRPLAPGGPTTFYTWDNDPGGIQVFVLAGQSNMVGHGKRDLGNGDLPGTEGSLRHLVDNDPDNFGHLVDGADNWITRTDVKVWWHDSEPDDPRAPITGDLAAGFGAGRNPTWFGPELGIGWQLGAKLDEPVLLVKTAWGGKSLNVDFRPPTAVAERGGLHGPYFAAMVDDVRTAVTSIAASFPEWAGQGYRIAGFAWHQGWNDRVDNTNSRNYEENLVDFIHDIRAEFGQPSLPVSIGTTGMDPPAEYTRVELAQLAVADPDKYPEFTGTVSTVDARPFWRPASRSPSSQGYHWNHNGESMFRLGDAIGSALSNLLNTP